MTLFRNKYRIESIRKQGWDYSSPGYYFVTICTLGKRKTLGDIVDDVVHLSEAGSVADRHWSDIASHYSTVSLDEYVVMPNHVHGIIILENPAKPIELRRNGGNSTAATFAAADSQALVSLRYREVLQKRCDRNVRWKRERLFLAAWIPRPHYPEPKGTGSHP